MNYKVPSSYGLDMVMWILHIKKECVCGGTPKVQVSVQSKRLEKTIRYDISKCLEFIIFHPSAFITQNFCK